MKISVVMAAYNGEKYIYQQLESLLKQTRKPDEVVVCDDMSKDRTVGVVNEFKREHPELSIVLSQNKQNLGFARNFFKATELSTGDLLFFSDQDDIWLPQKIEKMAECMENDDHIGGLVCLYEVIDEDSNVVRTGKKQNKEIKVKKESFQGMIRSFNCGGLNFAVRRKYVEKYRNFIIENSLPHDVPLGIILSSYGELYRINQIYVQHRVHGNNVSKPEYRVLKRLGNVERQIESAKNKLKRLEKCRPIVVDRICEKDKKNYDLAIDCYQKTITFLENQNIMGLIKLCFNHNPMIDERIVVFNAISAIMPRKRS